MPGGKFTDHVFGAMKEKDILRLEGPSAASTCEGTAKPPIILLAWAQALRPSRP